MPALHALGALACGVPFLGRRRTRPLLDGWELRGPHLVGQLHLRRLDHVRGPGLARGVINRRAWNEPGHVGHAKRDHRDHEADESRKPPATADVVHPAILQRDRRP